MAFRYLCPWHIQKSFLFSRSHHCGATWRTGQPHNKTHSAAQATQTCPFRAPFLPVTTTAPHKLFIPEWKNPSLFLFPLSRGLEKTKQRTHMLVSPETSGVVSREGRARHVRRARLSEGRPHHTLPDGLLQGPCTQWNKTYCIWEGTYLWVRLNRYCYIWKPMKAV